MTVLKGVGIDWTYLGKTMHTLDLSENRLSSIGVSYVGSAGNSIGKLIDTTFPSMPLLKTLNLSKNQIARLETMAFHLLPSLISVDLSNNKITHIQGFEANLKLMNLNLENNCVRVIQGIGQLENLETLNLANNRISTVVNLRPLSLNVGLRNLFLDGNPVSYLGRYRPSLISFVPHLDHIDGVPLPPSSAQKAARRVAKMLHDTHAGTVKQKRKKRVSNKKRPIMTPEKRDIITQKNDRSMATKSYARGSAERKESKDGEEKVIQVVDLEKELNLLIFERQEGDKRRGLVTSSAANLLSTTAELVKSDAYKQRSIVLSNRGITPSGLKKKVHGADFHKQQAWIEKMSEPKIEKKKPKLSKKYGFGAYPIPENFSPASRQRAGSKTSDKIASTLKVDVSTGKRAVWMDP